MAEKVLVPLDGSPLSACVLPWVHAYRARVPVDLFLLRVIPPVTAYAVAAFGGVEPLPVPDDSEERRREAAEALRAVAAAEGRPVTTLVREGAPGPEIIAAADEIGADLIVMSTHGRTGLARLLVGSVTEEVIRRSGRPVLVLRPSERELAAAAQTTAD